MKRNKGYQSLLTQKQYMLYLFSSSITRLGDSIDVIAFSWMVYEITNSAAWLSLVAGFNVLPTIFVTPFTAVIIDRWDKKKVLIVCDIGRGILVVVTAALYWAGTIQPWTIVLFTLINSTLEAFNTPAAATMLPRVLDSSLYDYGVGLRGTVSRTMELIGLGIAPVLMGIGGIGAALIVDSVLFVLSGIILMALQPKPEKFQETLEKTTFFQNFKASFEYMKQRQVVFFLCVVGMFWNFIYTPIGSMQTAYVQEGLRMGPEGLTLTGIGMTAGMMIGAWSFPMLKKKITASALLAGGAFASGISVVFFWLLPNIFEGPVRYPVLGLAMFVFGCGIALSNMVANVAFMEQVEPHYLGRISSIFNSMAMIGTPAMSFLSAPIVTVIPITAFYGIIGGIVLVSGLFIQKLPVTKELDTPYVATE